MMRSICVTTLAVALAGCAMPHSQVVSGSARPTLSLVGAPSDSELVLDGQLIGPANQYNGVNGVMSIEEGPHSVEVRHGNAVLTKKRILAASGEAVAVDVTTGGQ
ncbi:hypothetical protein OKW38_000422 [Paraburkholderia sp. MM5496-R1]|uniref:hypothetical protein n=1 Tax=unclassified Paraburkholderia TaxID=2615204 RepID=UPI001655200C|nr:hypothetical protein [Paraburkholderia sp. UCT31]MBC8740929.1 hypothetical protein [Paraburkholderia sp. UCT31]